LLKLNTTHLGDCFTLLKDVDANTVDLLLTDPPYGIDFISGQRKKNVHGKIKNDNNLDWLNEWLIEIKRVLKPDAHAYIFCSHHNLDVFLSTVKKHLPYKNLLVWEKNHFGMGDLKGDYAPKHELIIFCSNGKRKLNGKRDHNILKFSRTQNRLHPTEKPVDLFKFLIEKSTKENDLVLDTFAGSGTAGVACSMLDRNYIQMELDERYYRIAKLRVLR
jgi:site-specific DNA-methyltransferase (adenine-specific)